MRVIVWLGLVLGILWGGYWFVGSTAVEDGVAQWFADQNAQGVTATNDGVSVGGFPSRFDLTVTKPHLADPMTGWGWTAPFVQVLSMTWKPWHVIAVLPNAQTVAAPGEIIAVTSSRMVGSLRLSPSTDLTLNEMVVEGHDMRAVSDQGWQVGTKSLVLALARDTTRQNSQHLGLEIVDLTPDPSLAQLVPDLGAVISVVHLDATVVLTAELDRNMGQTQPGLTGFLINDFQLNWGSLHLSASGKVDRAPDGFATGQIDFRIKDWRQIPALMVALGLVRPEMGDTINRGLKVLAETGADPEVLELPLIFSEGRMNLGPLPLGAAPMLN